jgi:hypothetical protein
MSSMSVSSGPPRGSAAADCPVILALVKDTADSLAALLLAAELARARSARLHVAFVRKPWTAWAGTMASPVPACLWAEADLLAVGQLEQKVGGLLALTPVEWTFSSTVGSVRRGAADLVDRLSPIGVVIGPPRHRRLRLRWSVAQWLIGRPNIPPVLVSA